MARASAILEEFAVRFAKRAGVLAFHVNQADYLPGNPGKDWDDHLGAGIAKGSQIARIDPTSAPGSEILGILAGKPFVFSRGSPQGQNSDELHITFILTC